MKRLVNREPWWELPPKPEQNETDCSWGYLEQYDDGSFKFDNTQRPSDEEIRHRKGCRTHPNREGPTSQND
jgi:hypothetical protein